MSYSSRRVVLTLATAALAFAGLATPATAAQGEIRVGTGAKTIAGRYIVVLKENADAADIVTKNGGGEVRETWRHALKGFALEADGKTDVESTYRFSSSWYRRSGSTQPSDGDADMRVAPIQ